VEYIREIEDLHCIHLTLSLLNPLTYMLYYRLLILTEGTYYPAEDEKHILTVHQSIEV
jgi:hypothetical protein